MPRDLNELFVKAIADAVDRLGQKVSAPRLLISLSGGPDSTALLLSAHHYAQTSPASVVAVAVAHINHHLRGDESDNDEAFCRRICENLEIPIYVKQDVNQDVSSSVSEDALREKRYAFLRAVATDEKFDAVMTGHTVNDQAETLLFRLIRGTSLKGLGGIKQAREFAEGVILLRPLLSLNRDDVVAFLTVNEIAAREDSSNLQQKYSRNFIRQSLLKPTEERFPGASERIANFSVKAASDNDFIERQAEAIFEQLSLHSDNWELDELRYLHQSLLSRIFALGLKNRDIEIDSARIETLQSMLYVGDDYRVSLDGTWDASVDRNHIRWLNKEDDEALPDFEATVNIPGVTPIPESNRTLSIQEFKCDGREFIQKFPMADALEALVDLTQFTSETILLRRRLAGDYIQPLGMFEKVRLKKYLHTRKAAQQGNFSKSNCLVLACKQEILWVPGVGLSESIKVKARSQPTHHLSITDSLDEGYPKHPEET